MDKPEPAAPEPPVTHGWAGWGIRAGLNLAQGGTNPAKPAERDGEGRVSNPGFALGVFRRFIIHSFVDIRPEAGFIFRTPKFDSDTMDNVVELTSAGPAVTLPAMLVLGRGAIGFRLVGGLAVMLDAINHSKLHDAAIPTVNRVTTVLPQVLAGAQLQIGKLAIDAEYRQDLRPFAGEFRTTIHSIGIAVGYAVTRR